MNDSASVSGNTSSANGGGVYVSSSGAFIMNDSTLVSSNPNNGVTISGGSFIMNDSALVSSNNVGVSMVGTNASFTMNSSASISSNTGSGVSVNSGSFTMKGGTIYGSDGGANANGTSLSKGNDGVARYGNSSPIIAGDQTGVLSTDATLTGHN
jgi:hypothetical protein